MAGITAALIDSWADTKGMLPLLFLLFLGLEFFQHQRCEQLGELLRRAGVLGPLIELGELFPVRVFRAGQFAVPARLYYTGHLTGGVFVHIGRSNTGNTGSARSTGHSCSATGDQINGRRKRRIYYRPDPGTQWQRRTMGPRAVCRWVYAGRTRPCEPVPTIVQHAVAQTVQSICSLFWLQRLLLMVASAWVEQMASSFLPAVPGRFRWRLS